MRASEHYGKKPEIAKKMLDGARGAHYVG